LNINFIIDLQLENIHYYIAVYNSNNAFHIGFPLTSNDEKGVTIKSLPLNNHDLLEEKISFLKIHKPHVFINAGLGWIIDFNLRGKIILKKLEEI